MCFETKLYKKLTWSGDPGDRIEQEQVGSPVAEHKRETSTGVCISVCHLLFGWFLLLLLFLWMSLSAAADGGLLFQRAVRPVTVTDSRVKLFLSLHGLLHPFLPSLLPLSQTLQQNLVVISTGPRAGLGLRYTVSISK